MLEEIFFCRPISKEKFEKFDEKPDMILVRPKNPFRKSDEFFDENAQEWRVFDEKTALNGTKVEFALKPEEPGSMEFFGEDFNRESVFENISDIEDMDAFQVSRYIAYREKIREWKWNSANFTDGEGIGKNIGAAKISVDRENLTLAIEFQLFAEKDGTPKIDEKSVFFDMKSGKTLYKNWDCADENALDGEFYGEYDWRRGRTVKKSYTKVKRFNDIKSSLKKIEQTGLPKIVLEAAYKTAVELADSFCALNRPEILEKKIKPENFLFEMQKLFTLPFEPNLCEVVFSKEIEERKIKFTVERTKSDIYNEFCKKAKIKSYRTLRKCYAERPKILLTYIKIRDCGFSDLNLYNRVLLDEKNARIFDRTELDALKKFALFSIKRRGELCTMNTLLKGNLKHFDEKIDAIEMFKKYFERIPEVLKEDILKNGFTLFNHDALSNIAYQAEHENVAFEHTEAEKSLEDSVAGFEFRLPADKYELCKIGTSMHNCVASYADEVIEKECTIVYAAKDGEYALCIELRGNKVCQEKTDHNGRPDKAARAALDEWHARHKLVEGEE